MNRTILDSKQMEKKSSYCLLNMLIKGALIYYSIYCFTCFQLSVCIITKSSDVNTPTDRTQGTGEILTGLCSRCLQICWKSELIFQIDLHRKDIIGLVAYKDAIVTQ